MPNAGADDGAPETHPDHLGLPRRDREPVPAGAFVPGPSGFTVAAPVTTWSLIPSFGYAGESADP